MPGDEAGDNVTADPHKVSERPNSGKPDLIGDRMLWANGLRFLNPNERTVLVAVAYHDGPGGAYPSHKLLMAETGLGRSAVWKAITGLIGRGMLSRTRRQGSNLYAVDYISTVPTARTLEPNFHSPDGPDPHRPDDPDSGSPDGPDPNRKNRTERDRGGRDAIATRPSAPVTHPERVLARAGASTAGLAACASPTAAAPRELRETAPGTDEEDARQHETLVREARMDVLAELPPDDWSDQ